MVIILFILSLKSKLVEQYKSFAITWCISSGLIIPLWIMTIFVRVITCSVIIYTAYQNRLVDITIKNIFIYIGWHSLRIDQMHSIIVSIIMIILSLMCIPSIMMTKRALEKHPLIQLMVNSSKSTLVVKLGYVLPNIIDVIVLLFVYTIISIVIRHSSDFSIVIQLFCSIGLLILLVIDSKENSKWIKNRNIMLFFSNLVVGLYLSKPLLTYLHDTYGLHYANNFIAHNNNLYIILPTLIVIILLIAKIPREKHVSVYSIQKNMTRYTNVFYINGMLYFLFMGLLIGLLIQSEYIFSDFFLLVILASYPNTLLVEAALKTDPNNYEYMGQNKRFSLLESIFKDFQVNFNSRVLKLLFLPYVIMIITWLIHAYDISGIVTIIKYYIITGLWGIIIQETGMLAKVSQQSDIYMLNKQSRLSKLRSLVEGVFYIIVPISAMPEIMYITLTITKSVFIVSNVIQILIILSMSYVLFKYREQKWDINEIRRHTSI